MEGNAYIGAVNAIARIPDAFAATAPSALSEAFQQCVQAISESNKQAVAHVNENDDWAKKRISSVLPRLEKLAIDIFAKGLGDNDKA